MKTSRILIFAAGFVTGGLSSWAYLKRKYDERIDAERDNLRAIYIRKINSKSEDEKAPEQPENGLKTHSEGYDRQTLIDKMNNLTKVDPEARHEYQNYSSYYGGDDISDDVDVPKKVADKLNQLASQEHPTEKKLPYVIDVEDFASPEPAYEKITIRYYMDDDVLVDGLSHEIMDPNVTVGEENLAFLRTVDDDVIYVRNDFKGYDYEIEKLYSDYESSERGYHGIY